VATSIAAPRVIAYLVHGTWPRGGFLRHRHQRWFKPLPAWSDDGSDFRRAIEAGVPGIVCRSFDWTGENSEVDRRKEAIRFAERLEEDLRKEEVPVCIVVVAHSHGGNVALWALGRLDEELRSKIAGLATMATPFLSFMPHRLNEAEVAQLKSIRTGRYIMGIMLLSLVCAPVQYIYDPPPELPRFMLIPLMALMAVGIACLYRFMRRQRTTIKYLEENQPRTPPALASFLALRAPADEATRVITVADTAARLMGGLWILVRWYVRLTPWAAPRRWRRTMRKMAPWVALACAAMGAWIALAPREVIQQEGGLPWALAAVFLLGASSFLFVPLIWFVGMGLANMIAEFTRAFAAIGFGGDAALLSIANEVGAESLPLSPKGNLEMLPVGADDREMRHSLHAMPVARERLIGWILERREAVGLAADEPNAQSAN
jgi:hypothetical protein